MVSISEVDRSLWLKLYLQVGWQDCRIKLLNRTQLYLDPAEIVTTIFMPGYQNWFSINVGAWLAGVLKLCTDARDLDLTSLR